MSATARLIPAVEVRGPAARCRAELRHMTPMHVATVNQPATASSISRSCDGPCVSAEFASAWPKRANENRHQERGSHLW